MRNGASYGCKSEVIEIKKFIFICFVLFTACQQKPTLGVTESGVLVRSKDYRKVVGRDAIVFDTRSPFEFNTHKVPGSINLPVSDFQSSKDPFDAARRLSLYGVNPSTEVVIIGEGLGDEQKLAWEFIELGVTKIDTLKSEVFRMMNISAEPVKKNVALWKPRSDYSEMTQKDFAKKIESYRPGFSKARSAALQGVPSNALRTRVLVITIEKEWPANQEYPFADHDVFNDQNLFDDKGLLDRSQVYHQKLESTLKKYDVVFLLDNSMQKYAHAYAVTELGARSLILVH